MPGPADTAWVVNGGTAGIGGLVNASCGTLAVGGAGSGNVQLSAGGSLTAGSGGELIGYTGSGAFGQTGGTNSSTSLVYLGYNTGSSGSYSLSGGYLVSPVEYAGLGGSGAFIQTGGTNSISNYLTLGYVAGVSGSYNLSGNGYVSAPILYVGVSGIGAFTQTGGAVSLSSSLYLGYNTGSSGTVQPWRWFADFRQLPARSSAATPATECSTRRPAPTPTSGQSHGRQQRRQQLACAAWRGFLLAAQNVVVGYSGSGTFSQTGGVVATNQFVVGYIPNLFRHQRVVQPQRRLARRQHNVRRP